MSGSAILLQAEERSVTGKQVKRLRKSGLVPAVVYEKGVPSDNVTVSYIPMVKTWNKAGKHHAITLSYGNKKRLTIIKDVTLDPVKGQISHIAFQAIKLNEKIETEVPVVLEGHAPATVAGLLVHVNIDHLVVSGFPNDIPDAIVVDVSSVTTPEDDIRASELVLPKNIELVSDADSVIVSVIVPRAEVEKVEETVDAANVPSDNGAAKTEE